MSALCVVFCFGRKNIIGVFRVYQDLHRGKWVISVVVDLFCHECYSELIESLRLEQQTQTCCDLGTGYQSMARQETNVYMLGSIFKSPDNLTPFILF